MSQDEAFRLIDSFAPSRMELKLDFIFSKTKKPSQAPTTSTSQNSIYW
jgi:hypothetical protein